MLENIKKVHIMAVGGIGMSALCLLFMKKQIAVSGSDKSKSDLVNELISQGLAYKNENDPIDDDCDLVIYSSAIKPTHPQYQMAQARGIKLIHRSLALASLMEGKKALLVAGTHGKTTTSSLLVHCLKKLGQNPSYAIGGTFSHKMPHADLQNSNYFVAEADESDGSFLNYKPYGMIVTNVDNDHMDYWKTQEMLEDGFKKFMDSCENQKLCCFYLDDPVLGKLGVNATTYGHSANAHFKLVYDFASLFGRHFVFLDHDKSLHKGFVKLSGHHNAQNTLGVFSLLRQLGFAPDDIIRSFEDFEGVDRRCQIKGNIKNSLWIDDYGHHPTEIRTTILGIKEKYPTQSLVVIMQPHRFSRTADLWNEFHQAFFQDDEIIVTDIYAAGEPNPLGLHAKNLAENVSLVMKRPIKYIPRDELKKCVFDKDIVVTFGAGDICNLYHEVLS